MKKFLVALAVAALPLSASAKKPVDKGQSEVIRTYVVSLLLFDVPDPQSTMIIDAWQARSEPSVYCGFLNTKNRLGGYVGATGFTLDTEKGRLFLNTISRCDM